MTQPGQDIQVFSGRMVELIPRMMREITRRESNYLSRGKISLPQLSVLGHLARKEDCPMHELAQVLGVTRPAATGLVDRLIHQGLASRRGDSKDRRVVRVNLTAKGRKVLSTIWEQKRRVIAQVFGRLSAADRAHYLSTIEKVVKILAEEAP